MLQKRKLESTLIIQASLKKNFKKFGKNVDYRTGKRLVQCFAFLGMVKRETVKSQTVNLLITLLDKRTTMYNIEKQSKMSYGILVNRLQRLALFKTQFKKLRKEILYTYWNIVAAETIETFNQSKVKTDKDANTSIMKLMTPSGEILRNEMIENYLKKCQKKYDSQFKIWFKVNFETAIGAQDRAKGLSSMFHGRWI
jgi:hypothetical protein